MRIKCTHIQIWKQLCRNHSFCSACWHCDGNKQTRKIVQTFNSLATSSSSSWGSHGTPRQNGKPNPGSMLCICPAVYCQLNLPRISSQWSIPEAFSNQMSKSLQLTIFTQLFLSELQTDTWKKKTWNMGKENAMTIAETQKVDQLMEQL